MHFFVGLSNEMALGYNIDINKTEYATQKTTVSQLLMFWNNHFRTIVQFRLRTGLYMSLLLVSTICLILQETNSISSINSDYFDDVVMYYELLLYIVLIFEIVSLSALSYNYGTSPFAASLWL